MGKNKSISREQKKLEKAAFKADRVEAKREQDALKIERQDATKGVHNCPMKDAGTTHAFRARCLQQQHGGYCPACGLIFAWQHGCRQHEIKRENLLDKCPTEDEKREYRLANGLEEPAASDEESEEEAAPRRGRGHKGRKKSSNGGRR